MSEFNEGSIRTTPYINYNRVPSITVNYCRAYSFRAHCLPIIVLFDVGGTILNISYVEYLCESFTSGKNQTLMYSVINSLIYFEMCFWALCQYFVVFLIYDGNNY